MIKYEVNIEVNAEVAADYLEWLKPHITEILAIEGFIKADLFLEEVDDAALIKKITVDYYLCNQQAYENYIKVHAPRLRQDAKIKFDGLFTIKRRVLYLLKNY